MPPPNDNFTNAQVLDPAGINVAVPGSNIGATAEAGEPVNNGKTVWFRLTTPPAGGLGFGSGAIFISTANGNATHPLRTVVQVFGSTAIAPNPTTVATLREVDYLAAYKQAYGGWDFGSLVSFNVGHGATYYIRVDGVAAAEGNFVLTFGDYYALRMGACNRCAPSFGLGYACAGFAASDGSGLLGFGKISFPPGKYIVKYCGGTVQYENDAGNDPDWLAATAADSGEGLVWTVYFNGSDPINQPHLPGVTTAAERSRSAGIATLKVVNHPYPTGLHVAVSGMGGAGYNTGDAPITVIDANHFSYASAGPDESATAAAGTVTPQDSTGFLNLPSAAESGNGYSSAAAAENSARCVYTHFDHIGGNIRLGLQTIALDSVGQDNPSPPSWGLYSVTPFIQLAAPTPACASWISGGPGPAHATFRINNLNDVDWDLVSATLLTAGGVTSPGTVKNILLGKHGVSVVTIPFNSADDNPTVTLKLSCPFWPNDIVLPSIFLGPIVQFASSNGPYQDNSFSAAPIFCAGKKIYNFALAIRNLGYWSFGAGEMIVTTAATNGVLVGPYNTGFVLGPGGGHTITKCPTAASVTLPGFLGMPCNDAFQFPFCALVCPASAAAPVATVLTLTLATSGGVILFTQDFPITLAL